MLCAFVRVLWTAAERWKAHVNMVVVLQSARLPSYRFYSFAYVSVSNEVDVIVPTPNPFIGHFVCKRNNDVEIMPATVFRKSGEKIRAEKKIINIVALILRPFFFCHSHSKGTISFFVSHKYESPKAIC